MQSIKSEIGMGMDGWMDRGKSRMIESHAAAINAVTRVYGNGNRATTALRRRFKSDTVRRPLAEQ